MFFRTGQKSQQRTQYSLRGHCQRVKLRGTRYSLRGHQCQRTEICSLHLQLISVPEKKNFKINFFKHLQTLVQQSVKFNSQSLLQEKKGG